MTAKIAKSLFFIVFLTGLFLARECAAQLKVGVIVPLSGPLAEYGQAFQNGVKLAELDAPDLGNNCTFLFEDSRYDSKTAVSAFQKLISEEKVPVVYNWGGPTSEALAGIADRNLVTLFVWSAEPRVAENRQRVIRFANSGFDYGSVLMQYLVSKGYKSVGIVKAENQYIDSILSGFQKAAQGKIQIDIIDNYQPVEQDFRPTVTKLKARHYDSLGVFLLSGQVSQFVNQLKAQHVDIPLFGTDFFESMTEVQQSHGGMTGAVFANNQVSTDFREAYVRKFGIDLQINHAANGYDFATFLCQKIAPQLEAKSAQEIFERAIHTSSYAGKQGLATFELSGAGDRYFKFPVVIRRIKEAEIVSEVSR